MTLEIEFWHLIALGFSLLGAWVTGARVFFGQVEKDLDRRFVSMESQREALREWIKNHAKTEHDQIESIESTLRAQGERISRVEAELTHMPSHEDLTMINRRIDEIQRQVAPISSIESTVRMIHEHLLSRGG